MAPLQVGLLKHPMVLVGEGYLVGFIPALTAAFANSHGDTFLSIAFWQCIGYLNTSTNF